MSTLDLKKIQEIDINLYKEVNGGNITYTSDEKIPKEYSYYIEKKKLYPDVPELPTWPKPD
ncbi:hypothetical protein [Aestuariibacter sp. A3R04]|uniref:hypothetical protein n=1 Tax=Aestuariibacter sp. A3R04 TaxID=2841571 RepID=UPI001C083BDD|nr:hypothetical protein [Aestuariibacter sp. A3R04]MBU3023650.1 hypothetical protein [Aestuariibacter sp. A3R04]